MEIFAHAEGSSTTTSESILPLPGAIAFVTLVAAVLLYAVFRYLNRQVQHTVRRDSKK